MDQLIHASLSQTHHWYEVGMLKVPAICTVPKSPKVTHKVFLANVNSTAVSPAPLL